MTAKIIFHEEKSMAFLMDENGAESWLTLDAVKDSPAFRSYFVSLSEPRKQRVQAALAELDPSLDPFIAPPTSVVQADDTSDTPSHSSSGTPAHEEALNTPLLVPSTTSDPLPPSPQPVPKRGRGRPPKPKPPVDPNAPVPIKRGRGRPPKKKPDDDTSSPKRPRGRPPKSRDPSELATSSDGTPVKRGRGRPRKRPLSPESSDGTSTPAKRGRGRPRKVQKLSDRGDSSATPVKRGRGRPRKYASEGIYGPLGSSLSLRPVAERQSVNVEELGASSRDPDEVRFSDGNERLGYFLVDNQLVALSPAMAGERAEELYRAKRVPMEVEAGKILIVEDQANILSQEHFSVEQKRALAALQCFLPAVNLVRSAADTGDLLCLSCGHRRCHAFCGARVATSNAQDTLNWMNKVAWLPERSFTISTLLQDLPLTPERLQAFLAKHADHVPSSMAAAASDVVEAIRQHAPALIYVAENLRIEEIRPARLQRAVHRFATLDLDSMTFDDYYLAMKLCQLLQALTNEKMEAEDAWRKLTAPPSQPEGAMDGLHRLAEFTGQLYQVLGIPMKTHVASETRVVGDDYSTEQVESDWGINVMYVENASPAPVANQDKCALYCSVTPRQDPSTIARTVLRRLEKELDLVVNEDQTGAVFDDKVMAGFSAVNKVGDTTISCTADNWAGRKQVHLLIRIASPHLATIVETLKREIAMMFRLDDLEKHLTVLYYNQAVQTMLGDVELEFTTGEVELQVDGGPALVDTIALPSYPSTLCVGRRGGAEVVRMVLTYSHNMETLVNGPTIQYMAVHKSYRNQGLGSALLRHVELEFLKFWKPTADRLELYGTYVTNAHSYFIKQGFRFYDCFNEECVKTIHRGVAALDGKITDDQPMQEASDTQLDGAEESFVEDTQVEDTQMEDTQVEDSQMDSVAEDTQEDAGEAILEKASQENTQEASSQTDTESHLPIASS